MCISDELMSSEISSNALQPMASACQPMSRAFRVEKNALPMVEEGWVVKVPSQSIGRSKPHTQQHQDILDKNVRRVGVVWGHVPSAQQHAILMLMCSNMRGRLDSCRSVKCPKRGWGCERFLIINPKINTFIEKAGYSTAASNLSK